MNASSLASMPVTTIRPTESSCAVRSECTRPVDLLDELDFGVKSINAEFMRMNSAQVRVYQ